MMRLSVVLLADGHGEMATDRTMSELSSERPVGVECAQDERKTRSHAKCPIGHHLEHPARPTTTPKHLKQFKRVANALSLTLLLALFLARGVLAIQDGRESTLATITTTTGDSETSTSSPSPPSLPSTTVIELTTSDSNSTVPQVASKLKPVNFTLVDELFESVLSEPEVLRRWRNMDSQFQEGIRSILKLVFPQIVAISQDAKVSGDCSGGILKWILSLRNLRSWAIKMLDATGKPTAGIFEGSLTMFGNHRQCLSIRAPDEDEIEITEQFEEYFRGQFCVLHLRPWLPAKKPFYHLNSTIEPLLRKNYKYYEKTLYDELAEIAIAFNFIDIRMDMCVPSTCSIADIQRVADLLSKKLEMKAKVMRCDIESRETTTTFMQNLDKTTAYWLIAPLGLILINVISSILVALGVFNHTGNGNDDNIHVASSSSHNARHSDLTSRASLASLFYSLSIQGALNNLLANPRTTNVIIQRVHDNNNNNNDDDGASRTSSRTKVVGTSTCQLDREEILRKPLPLYGLRNVFIIWFVIVQLTVELKYQYLRESLVLRNMMLAYWPFQIIINTSMIFESLILITAFTYSYCNLETSTKGLLSYIASKYIRLVPSIVTLILVTIILPSIGITSPVWKNFVEQQSAVCKSTGYIDLSFLQNFIAYDKICLPHTWLFCVELQLIALSIPLVILLKKTLVQGDTFSPAIQCEKDRVAKRANQRDGFRVIAKRLLASRVGLLGLVLVLLGAAINFFLVYLNQLPPSWFHTFPDADQKTYYFGKYLTKTWTHLSAFIIGIYAGCLTRSTIPLIFDRDNTSHSDISSVGQHSGRQERNLIAGHRSLTDIAWRILAFGCLLSIIFCTYTWSTEGLPTPLVSALYDSLSRVVWSLALASLTARACLPRNVNNEISFSGLSSLFSHPVCLVLGRLSFLAYLISPLVHTFVLAVQEQSLFPSLYLIFHVILGNIVITYLLAFVLSMMIEQPIRLVARQLCYIHTRSRGSVTISASNVTTTTNTSATSLANQQ